MSKQSKHMDELRQLLTVVLDDELTAEQLDRLHELLDADPAARDLYARHMTLHAYLERLHVGAGQTRSLQRNDSLISDSLHLSPDRINRRKHAARLLSLAVVLTLVVCVGFYFYIRPASLGDVAKLLHAVDAEWGGDEAMAPIVNSRLRKGQLLEMKSGLAEIRFDSGVSVVLEGPAELTIDDENACSLRLGRLVGRVPDEAVGFAVTTPSATVVDLGTEFGVAVTDSGDAETWVFEGTVELIARQEDQSSGERLKLNEGQGGRVVAGTRTLARTEGPDRPFIQKLPAGFTPDPSKKYYIDCPATGERLCADGSEVFARIDDWSDTFAVPKAVEQSQTGANVEWMFVAAGDRWHIQLAAGGDEPRLWAVKLPQLRGLAMTSTDKGGGWTQFTITAAGGGKYFLTAPEGPKPFRRLNFVGGKVGMGKSTERGPSFQVVITEVGSEETGSDKSEPEE